MGREGMLPRVLGRTHAKHKSPFVATVFVGLMVVMITSLFASGAAGGGQRAELGIDESSPLTSILQLGTWIPFQGNAILFPLWTIVDGPRRGLKRAWIWFVMSLFTSFGFSMAAYLAAQERHGAIVVAAQLPVASITDRARRGGRSLRWTTPPTTPTWRSTTWTACPGSTPASCTSRRPSR